MADYYVATTGNDSTGDGSSGNPYASPGKVGGVWSAGDTMYVKYGSYSIGTGTVNTAGNAVTVKAGCRIIGYDTAIGDIARRPTLQCSGASTTILSHIDGQAGTTIRNLILDGNSQTASRGVGLAYNFHRIEKCDLLNFVGNALKQDASVTEIIIEDCYATACSVTPFAVQGSTVLYRRCVAVANGGSGFSAAFGTYEFCISAGNTGWGFGNNDFVIQCSNCTAYGNTSHGFFFGTSDSVSNQYAYADNCISYGNGGYGFSGEGSLQKIVNCAGGSNTSGNYTSNFVTTGGRPNRVAFAALTGDPFANAAGGDFSLNNTAGAGAACRATGNPGTFPGGLTTGYADIGAAQHQDAGGSTTISITNVQPIQIGRLRAVGI